MKDWIDEEAARRRSGVVRPLLQSEHWEVNTRYPGCTLEYCEMCGGATGNAGRGEDSIYIMAADGSREYGPLCYRCKTELIEEGVINEEYFYLPRKEGG